MKVEYRTIVDKVLLANRTNDIHLFEDGPEALFSPSRISQNKTLINNYLQGILPGFTPKVVKKKLPNSAEVDNDSLQSYYENVSNILDFKTIKEMSRDPVIAFGYALISSVLRSLPYSVKSHSDIQRFLIEDLLREHYDSIMESLCTSIYNGFAISQILWKKKYVRFTRRNSDGSLDVLYEGTIDWIQNVKHIDPSSETIRYYADVNTEELTAISQYNVRTKTLENAVMRNQMVHHSSGNPFNKIFGRSRFVNLVKEFELSKIVYRYLLSVIDNSSDPPIEVSYPNGSSYSATEQRSVPNSEVASTLLNSVKQSNGYTIESDLHPNTNQRKWEVKVKTDWEKKNGETLKGFLEWLNNQKLVGLFVPPQLYGNREVSNSSSAIQASMELFMFMEEPMVAEFEKVIRKDIIERYLYMNFPVDEVEDFEFKIDRSLFNRRQIIKELVLTLARINGNMIASPNAQPVITPDFEAILDQLNIPVTHVSEAYTKLTGEEIGKAKNIDGEQQRNEDRNGRYRVTKRISRAGKKKPVTPGA